MSDPLQKLSLSKKSPSDEGTWDFAVTPGFTKVSSLSLCSTTTREIRWRLEGWVVDVAIRFDMPESSTGKVSGSMDSSLKTLRSKRYSCLNLKWPKEKGEETRERC